MRSIRHFMLWHIDIISDISPKVQPINIKMDDKYNRVAPRLSLGNGEQPDYKNPIYWPKPLHDFISRSFIKSEQLKLHNKEKKQFQNELKTLINKAIDEGKMEENDWTKQKIPSIERRPFKLDLYCNSVRKNKSQQRPNPIGTNSISVSIPQKRNVFGNYDNEGFDYGDSTGSPRVVMKPIKKRKKAANNNSMLLGYKTRLNGENNQMLSEKRKQLRSERFRKQLSYVPTMEPEPTFDPSKPLIGKCEKLEKRYLRLTTQPKPELVRPVPVLKKTLSLLLSKYTNGESYGYLCDQFKSMRQDLTVQNVQTKFTVLVYEIHAKLAMEFGDLGEFNQCQSQLKLLFQETGSKGLHKYEFYAYKILYCILTDDMNEAMALKLDLLNKTGASNDPYLKEAMKCLDYELSSNYYGLISVIKKTGKQLAKSKATSITKPIDIFHDKDASNLGHPPFYFFYKFLEQILDKERVRSLNIICHSYRQIDLDTLKSTLLFANQSDFQDFCHRMHISGSIQNDKYLDCHSARGPVQRIKEATFSKVDIKGQI